MNQSSIDKKNDLCGSLSRRVLPISASGYPWRAHLPGSHDPPRGTGVAIQPSDRALTDN